MADKPLNMRDTFGANDLSKQLLGLAGSHAVRHDWGGDHAVPTVNTDSADHDGNRNGWGPGSVIFASDSYVYECAVATPGAAVWARIPLMNATTGGTLEILNGESITYTASAGGDPGESVERVTRGETVGAVALILERVPVAVNTTLWVRMTVMGRYVGAAGWLFDQWEGVYENVGAGAVDLLGGTVDIGTTLGTIFATGLETSVMAAAAGNIDLTVNGIAAGPTSISWVCKTEYVTV